MDPEGLILSDLGQTNNISSQLYMQSKKQRNKLTNRLMAARGIGWGHGQNG